MGNQDRRNRSAPPQRVERNRYESSKIIAVRAGSLQPQRLPAIAPHTTAEQTRNHGRENEREGGKQCGTNLSVYPSIATAVMQACFPRIVVRLPNLQRCRTFPARPPIHLQLLKTSRQ